MIKQKYKHLLIEMDTTILAAFKRMDEIKRKLLIVLSNNKYFGLISVGDIQRAIIKNISMDLPVSSIMRNDYIIASPGQDRAEMKKNMLKLRAEFMPEVDDNMNIVDIYFWEDLFGTIEKRPLSKFDLPVVIMAGGEGTRLKPITNVLPKPLIPLKEKTIIEDILESFAFYGCQQFYISLNYKADLIEYYLKSLNNQNYQISFLRENKPLGTAGSLDLLKDKITSTFFVSNCDILIEQDYSEVLEYHRSNKNLITIIAVVKHFPIKYGTIETGENGSLVALTEKPELNFKINTGVYILEPETLEYLPKDKIFHITDLIEILVQKKIKVGVFPVGEGAWIDIGNWDEYLRNIKI